MFATVICLILPMCILISCSSVLCVCVNGIAYVYVCESYVVLDQCEEPPSLFVLSVCAYGGVVMHFFVFSFLCDFC